MRVARTSEALPFSSPTFPAEAASERSPEVGAPTGADERAPAASGVHPFLQMLRGLGQALDRGESIAERAIHGAGAQAGMSPQRLIALQAGIYRYSEAVDLVTKLVDRGTQAVRTTLQNQ